MFAPHARALAALLVLALLAFPGVLSMSEPSCEEKGKSHAPCTRPHAGRSTVILCSTLTEYCPGQEPDTFSSGSTVQEVLTNLRSTFCGCKRIGGSVNVFFPKTRDGYNLTEDDFNSLYHLEEVGGGVSFFNIPPLDILTLPNLVLIRGNNLPYNSLVAGGFAL